MTLSYSQLDSPLTEAQAEAEVIQRLSELGFDSKGWQSGDMKLTLAVKLPAWLYSKYSFFTQELLRGGFNETATGTFLTKLAKSHYDNTRKPAVAARYSVQHTVEAGEGPHTVNVGDLVATNGSFNYTNIDDGSIAYPVTLTSASPVRITYEAEIPGKDANTGPGTITTLVTSVAGVTITNPDSGPIQAGADEEKDPALKERNTSKWGLLSIEVPSDGYKNLALQVTGIGRAEVDDQNPDGPGTVRVYIAGSNAPAGAGLAAEAQTKIDARKSATATVAVLDAPQEIVTVSGEVFYSSAYSNTAPTAIDDAIEQYVNELRIGGTQLTSSLRGVPRDGIIAAIRAVPGVLNVNLTSPTEDFILSAFSIATASISSLTKTAL